MARSAALAALLLCTACSPYRLLRYAAAPDAPQFADGEEIAIDGLAAPVAVAQRDDGIYRIRAASEHDAAMAMGYLMARDRMAQMDIFRHLARGELASLLGDRPFGERSSVEMDVLNRFLGFTEQADQLRKTTSPGELALGEAFVAGINRWIEAGHLSLEHRLLGVETIRPWTLTDSLAIYTMFMHGLSADADREIRRLAVACRVGLDAMERVFPTGIEFPVHALPDADLRTERYPVAPAVVPEMAAALDELCPDGAESEDRRAQASIGDRLYDGWSASNNWVVASFLTASGKPILSSDPHLPHMNPPIVWGVELELPDVHVVGFVMTGLPRIVFGHNGHVAWGVTTNHVDRQDLVVYRPRTEERDGRVIEGYEHEGRFVPFGQRTETFVVKDGDPVTVTARLTPDGPLLNDIDVVVRGRIPLTAMRRASFVAGRDIDGAQQMNEARNFDELAAGIAGLDLGCSSYVLADTAGSIGYRTPCVVPKRSGFSGAFPVPGWVDGYGWEGFYAKAELPASTNPARGWLATANNQIVPSDRFPSTFNAGASGPNRYVQIADRLAAATADRALTASGSAAIQIDRRDPAWRAIRASIDDSLCRRDARLRDAERELLCAWDGDHAPDSAAATLFVLLSNALLDRAVADEFPEGADDPLWHFVQTLPQFEVRAQWLWTEPETAELWDDVRTETRETRADVLELAFADAVAAARDRFGSDAGDWAWGEVRPFVLRHPFAAHDGVLGWFLNEDPLAVGGGPETVFKNQFPRSDRERMNPAIGPVFRFTVDMADPWSARYTLAGGQSGWPLSPHYGDLLEDWAAGRDRPLSPAPAESDVDVRLVPAS
jgi:acyl-homoserine lactone acylase PvdQ